MQILDELLAAYRTTPCAELHALLVRASAGLAPPPPDALRGRLKGALASWTERAKAPTSAEVPALLETLPDGGSRVAVGRMQTVNAWGPDPRVDEQIAKWIDDSPWEGDIAKRFWREVFARMEKIRDPALCERLADPDMGGRNLDSMMTIWVRNARIRAIEVAAKTPYNATPPRAQLESLTASVDEALAKPKVTTPAARSKASLLDEIRKHPDDTDTRLVYADALIAEDDPYGELIAIQCAKQIDAKSAKRAAQLLKKHGNTWLGPLVNVVMKHYVFERGFLARCRISSSKRAAVPKVVGHPAWSTVRAIGGSSEIALHPVMISLRELSFWGDRTTWRNLLVDVKRPLEHLGYATASSYRERIDAEQFEALGECAALPSLQTLSVSCRTDEFIELLQKPIAKRLRAIRAASAGSGFVYQGEPWVAEIIAACNVPVLEIYVQCMLRVEQGGVVTITLTDPRQQVGVAIALVPHLPASTKRVTIRAVESVTAAQRESIAAAIRARLGDVVAPSITIPDEVPNQVDVAV